MKDERLIAAEEKSNHALRRMREIEWERAAPLRMRARSARLRAKKEERALRKARETSGPLGLELAELELAAQELADTLEDIWLREKHKARPVPIRRFPDWSTMPCPPGAHLGHEPDPMRAVFDEDYHLVPLRDRQLNNGECRVEHTAHVPPDLHWVLDEAAKLDERIEWCDSRYEDHGVHWPRKYEPLHGRWPYPYRRDA